MTIELTVNTKALQNALVRGPKIIEKHLDLAILKTVKEMAKAARQNAPRAHNLLMNTIHPLQISAYEGLVVAGADYASLVEFGTKPDGHIPGKRSDSKRYKAVLDWVRVGSGIHPDDPDMSQEDLAYVIARSIALKGTPAKPFMEPAFEDNRERAVRNINEAIRRALSEISK